MTQEPAKYAAEIEHDTKLLELLGTVFTLDREIDEKARYCLSAASKVYIGHDHTGTEVIEDEFILGRSKRVKLDDLEDGKLYYQSKTWTRGEEGYWIKVVDPERPHTKRKAASVSDALERLEESDRVVLAYRDAIERRKAASAAVAAHEEHYTGWNRYFLVVSSAGHVHRSMNCSTCYPTTAYSPVVSLSGHEDDEAVAALGNHLCSTCFPELRANGKPKKLSKAAAKKILAA